MKFDDLRVTQSLEQGDLSLHIPLLLGVLQFVLLVDFHGVTILFCLAHTLLHHCVTPLSYDIAYIILVSQIRGGSPLLFVPTLQ